MSSSDLSALRPYWHPVASADEVGEEPHAVRLLGEAVVLVRSGENVNAFQDLCVHRGARISKGWLDQGRLVCPYHGWSYDRDGRCVYIPSQGREQKIPSRAKLLPYRCELRYGLVWVALEEPKLPIPPFSQYDDPAFKVHVGFREFWKTSAARFAENALDFSHFAFVHPNLLGDPDRAEIEPYELKLGEAGFAYELDWHAEKEEHLGPEGASLHYEYFLDFPFTVRLNIHSDIGLTTLFTPTQPIAEGECSMWLFFARNHSHDTPDSDFTNFSKTIWQQDRVVVEEQRPEMLPVDLREELHVKYADAPGIALRRMLQKIGVDYA